MATTTNANRGDNYRGNVLPRTTGARGGVAIQNTLVATRSIKKDRIRSDIALFVARGQPNLFPSRI